MLFQLVFGDVRVGHDCFSAKALAHQVLFEEGWYTGILQTGGEQVTQVLECCIA